MLIRQACYHLSRPLQLLDTVLSIKSLPLLFRKPQSPLMLSPAFTLTISKAASCGEELIRGTYKSISAFCMPLSDASLTLYLLCSLYVKVLSRQSVRRGCPSSTRLPQGWLDPRALCSSQGTVDVSTSMCSLNRDPARQPLPTGVGVTVR